jgi:hypothetical protein
MILYATKPAIAMMIERNASRMPDQPEKSIVCVPHVGEVNVYTGGVLGHVNVPRSVKALNSPEPFHTSIWSCKIPPKVRGSWFPVLHELTGASSVSVVVLVVVVDPSGFVTIVVVVVFVDVEVCVAVCVGTGPAGAVASLFTTTSVGPTCEAGTTWVETCEAGTG